ncbi:LysR family transcriptional regulator [Pseudomonas sp. MPC6]|uniref:LysR family transcriptional regulator n=1 Tax=Pseudomonas sp. MPC6 TaxID=2498848 RepID=UPI0023DD9095|nr:LysR family transcriptional regulator [Pseudomonas sp. MPC6]
MNRNDLRRVDMNLLVIFETLMFEKNLTRAGEKLFLGQPAVSASLAKLRDLFDDPLLVRNGRVLEPTQRALQILKELQPAMDTISGALSRAKDFDPSTSRDVFRIGLSDDAEFGLFPPLLKQMREEAQNVVVRRVNFLLMSSMLASGEISVGVSCTPELPANTKRKKPCWPMLANRWPPPTSWPWTWRTIWTDQPQRPAGHCASHHTGRTGSEPGAGSTRSTRLDATCRSRLAVEEASTPNIVVACHTAIAGQPNRRSHKNHW